MAIPITQRPIVLGGKGSVEDLKQEMRLNGVTAVRAIQTVSFYGYDNRYLCDSAKANRGWLARRLYARSGRRS